VKGIRLEKKGKRLELDLYGTVGSIWDDGINAAKVVALLRNAEDVTEIECRINSMGGNAFDGIAIMNALKDHPAEVTVKVDGLAASAASIIAMAGDTIEMGEGSFLMVHRASGFVYGQANDMLKTAEILEKADGEIIDVYARRSKKPVETVRGWVEAETWFTGQEAVDAGLADKAVADPESKNKAAEALAGHGAIFNFANLPESLRNLVEAHRAKGADTPPPETQEDDDMDLKDLTSAALAEARPDLVDEIKAAAKLESAEAVEAAIKAERERAGGIAAKAAELGSAVDVAKLINEGTDLQAAWQQMLVAKQEEMHQGAQASDLGHDSGDERKVNPFLPKEG